MYSRSFSRSLFVLMGLLFSLVSVATVIAQNESADSGADETSLDAADPLEPLQLQPLIDKTAGDVDALIPQLASASYQDRKAARLRLLEIGPPAFTKLRDAYLINDDLEVRLLIEEIVHTSYLAYHVYSQKGFLGVQLREYRRRGAEDNRIPKGVDAVVLARIISGTAAERAGLQRDDVIVALEGKPLPVTPKETFDPAVNNAGQVVDGVSRMIAARRPGDRLTFTLWRGMEVHDIEIRLGRWSEDLRRQGNVVAINESLAVAHQRFGAWWQRHFLDRGEH